MDSNDDDDDYGMTMTRKLPVSTFTEYDPNTPPQSGADYLRRVQLEAIQQPKIKVADNLEFLKNIPAESNLVDEKVDDDLFYKSLPDFKIPKETVEQLIERFKDLRGFIDNINLKMQEKKPFRRAKRWWKEHCLTKPEDLQFINYELKNVYSTNIPRISILSQLEQNQIYKLLRYHLEWIQNVEKFTVGNGLWIYALLASLYSILPGDIYSLLRDISRQCSRIRHHLELNINHKDSYQLLSSLNIIIMLIGHYFGQKDLLDD